MGSSLRATRKRIALVTAVSLLMPPSGLVVGTAQPAKPGPSTPGPPAVDGGWPRAYTTSSGASLIVYQPQIASWVNQKHAVLYAAVSYTPKGAKQAALGTVTGYCGDGNTLDRALADFAEAYGDQTERDHAELTKASSAVA